MSKFNLGGQQANNVANNLIPECIGNLVNKTNDPNDSSFSLEKLLSSITGGQTEQVAQQIQVLISETLLSQFSGGQQSMVVLAADLWILSPNWQVVPNNNNREMAAVD